MRDSSKHRDFNCSQFAIILARTGDNVTKCRKKALGFGLWALGLGVINW